MKKNVKSLRVGPAAAEQDPAPEIAALAKLMTVHLEGAKVIPKVQPAALDNLSFIAKAGKGGGFDYWANVPAGETYSQDYETGARLAEEFIAFLAENQKYGNTCLLGSIMISMETNGATKGHKIGFMNTINKYAMAGGYAASMVQGAVNELLENEAPASSIPIEPEHDITMEELGATEFEPWLHEKGEWAPPTNTEWTALANPHLIMLRVAWALLHQTKAELRGSIASLLAEEEFFPFVDRLTSTTNFMKGLSEVMNIGLSRVLCVASAFTDEEVESAKQESTRA